MEIIKFDDNEYAYTIHTNTRGRLTVYMYICTRIRVHKEICFQYKVFDFGGAQYASRNTTETYQKYDRNMRT